MDVRRENEISNFTFLFEKPCEVVGPKKYSKICACTQDITLQNIIKIMKFHNVLNMLWRFVCGYGRTLFWLWTYTSDGYGRTRSLKSDYLSPN